MTRELDIAILAPEHLPGGAFVKAKWVLQGASDMVRIDYYDGGITASYKLATVAESFGFQCEMHGGGWANRRVEWHPGAS